MKSLLLVRHAKSDWTNNLPDFDRPLNKRGSKDAPAMAKRLLAQKILPQLLLSSPANRALSTAKAFAKELGYQSSLIQEQQTIYEAGVSDLLYIVNSIDNRFDSVALFGHNPGISLLAHYLCSNAATVDFPTAAVMYLIFEETDSWAEISMDTARLSWYSYPKLV